MNLSACASRSFLVANARRSFLVANDPRSCFVANTSLNLPIRVLISLLLNMGAIVAYLRTRVSVSQSRDAIKRWPGPERKKAPIWELFCARDRFIFLLPPLSSTYWWGTSCHSLCTSLPLPACPWRGPRNHHD